MATLRLRTRSRVLTVFTLVAVVFAMTGAAPAQEAEEPEITPAADQTIDGNLQVWGDLAVSQESRFGGVWATPADVGIGSVGVGKRLTVTSETELGPNPTLRLYRFVLPAPPNPYCYVYWDLESNFDFDLNHASGCDGTPVDERGPLFHVSGNAPTNALVLDDNHNSMSQPLHVSANVGAGVTPSYVLENNGAPMFFYKNSATGDEFQFSLLSNGEFVISALGTGGPELVVAPSGAVRMGPGPSNTFILDPAGNLTITGNLTTAGGTLSANEGALRAKVDALESENAELRALAEDLSVRLEALESR